MPPPGSATEKPEYNQDARIIDIMPALNKNGNSSLIDNISLDMVFFDSINGIIRMPVDLSLQKYTICNGYVIMGCTVHVNLSVYRAEKESCTS